MPIIVSSQQTGKRSLSANVRPQVDKIIKVIIFNRYGHVYDIDMSSTGLSLCAYA